MTKYEIIFLSSLGATLLFLTNANFKNIIWEFTYYFDHRFAWLVVGYLMIERAQNLYELKIANLSKKFFISLILWEILASISWDFANGDVILLALFLWVLFLFFNLFREVHKRISNERKCSRRT